VQLMVDLNKRLGRFTNENLISIGTPVLIPDICLRGKASLPANCRAVNDCANGNGNSVCPSASSTCDNTDLAFACACKAGFLRSTNEVCATRFPTKANNLCTKSCEDDPCSPNPCSGGTCSRSGGSFTCTCPAGTTLSGTTCVNPCASVNCGVGGAGCSGGVCTCKAGYSLTADRKACVDRCAKEVPCTGPTATCTAGTCTCGAGHVLKAGGVCESSTACDTGSFKCDGGQCTLDETNQRVCRCPSGFTLQSGTCVDVDECKDGSHECKAPATCVNQFGSTYTCTCGAGLVLKNQFECGKACANMCASVGTCVDGTCQCAQGYVSDAAEGCRAVCPGSPLECSGKGTCANGACICADATAQTLDCSDPAAPGGGEGPGGGSSSTSAAAQDEETTAPGPAGPASKGGDSIVLVVCVSVAAGVILWIVLVVLYLAWRRKRQRRAPVAYNPTADFVFGPSMGQYQQRPAPQSDRFHFGDTGQMQSANGGSVYGGLELSARNHEQSFPAQSAGTLPVGEARGYPSFQGQPYSAQQHDQFATLQQYDVSSPEPSNAFPQPPYAELDRSEFHKYSQQ